MKRIFIVRYADDFKILCKTHDEAVRIFNATKQWLRERLHLEISEEKSKIVNLRKQYSEFLGFKIKLIKRHGRYVIKSHMADKSKARAKQMLKASIYKVKRGKENPGAMLNKINSQIIGLHQYYNAATMVNRDFNHIAYELGYLIENTFKSIAKEGKFKKSISKYITDTYLKRNNYKTYKINDMVLIPMVYVSHKIVRCFKQNLNIYSTEGRENIDYKRLVIEEALKDKWKCRVRYDSTELLDNSISKMSAQQLKCAVTGLFVTDGEIHHIIPREMGGDDRFQNLIYVDKHAHKLIHITDSVKIQLYLEFFKNLLNEDYKKFVDNLNKYRLKAGNAVI